MVFGGSWILFLAGALLPILILRESNLAWPIVSGTVVLCGLVGSNYLAMYLSEGGADIKIHFFGFVFFGILILFNHIFMLYHFLGDPFSEKWTQSENQRKIARHLFTTSYFSLAVPFGLAILLVAVLGGLSKRNIDLMGMKLTLGGMLVGGLMANWKLRGVLDVISCRPNVGLRTSAMAALNKRKTLFWLWTVSLSLLLLSVGWESYRGQWLIWGLTVALGWQYLAFVWRLSKIRDHVGSD